jgi:HSP20 family protein
MKSKKQIITVVSAVTLAVFLATPLIFADEDSQGLKRQVTELQQKVAELEQALQDKNAPAGYYPSMPVRTWNPFMEMNQIQNVMNSMFENSLVRGIGQDDFGGFNPAADIHETDNQYVLTLDLPGMEKANINIETRGNQLVISGEKKSSSENEDQVNHYYQKERSFGYFSNSIPLPEDADQGAINADYKDGVLTVKIDKLASAKSKQNKKIKIN